MIGPPAPNYARAAIYARYSDSKQRQTSIDDQLRECRKHVADNNGVVASEFWDSKLTGATLHARGGLRALLKHSWEGAYTVVVTESLDRLSRDQADTAIIYRQLEFLGVHIFAIDDGIVTPLHIGLKGTMNSMFLQSLSQKTRRGQLGVAHAGRSIGPPPYGYRVANRIQGSQVTRGIRELHTEHAATVQRVFQMYAEGTSARAISIILNDEGIPPPRGGKFWRHNYFVGASTRSPMLRNLTYRGNIVAGMNQSVRNPKTGKRNYRPIPKSEWIIVPAPHLRIVEDDLWFAVQERIDHAAKPRNSGSTKQLRGAMPLTPLLTCPQCNGPIRTFARDRWACQNALNEQCSVPTFSLRKLDLLVAQHLFDWVHEQTDWSDLLQLSHDRQAKRIQELKHVIAETQLKIDRLTLAIENGTGSFSLSLRVATLDAQLLEQQRKLTMHSAIPCSLPEPSTLQHMLRERTALLLEKASHPAHVTRSTAAAALAEVIDRIDMSPGPGRSKAFITVHPNLLELVRSVSQTDDEPAEE